MTAGMVEQEGEDGKSECEMERSNRLVFYGLSGDASSCMVVSIHTMW